MDADAMTRHIAETFDGIRTVHAFGDTFFLLDPSGELPGERRPPVATVVTDDNYDTVSGLGEPGAYRINIGLSKDSYTERFGPAPHERDADGVLRTGHDHSARDEVLPHPHYASQYWVCVVNPGERTLEDVRTMLDESYGIASRKYANQAARRAARGSG